MVKLIELPLSFNDLRQAVPEDFSLSERLIEPVILIDRVEGHIVAQLGGSRLFQGKSIFYPTPSNEHAWIVDNNILRPLPVDAPALFKKLVDQKSKDFPYSQAISLLRNSNGLIGIQATEAFLKAGRISADEFTDKVFIPGLSAQLFPYQARGVQWMWETISHTDGIILADEMGLGKTLQIIALLLMEPPPESAPALIVCPTSLIANWVREIKKFAPSLTVLIHRGAHRTGIYKGLQKANVVITTYDTMVNDISIFSGFEWSWLICDEAQAIKNPGSERRQAIVTIPRKRTIPMTGTPVENTLLDLWSLTDFAIPGLLGTQSEFEVSYPDNQESARELGRLTDPIILMRKVSDVAGDLPERIDIDIPLELDETLAEQYRRVREETLAKYPVAGNLVATLQLQLFCAHPRLRRADDKDETGEEAILTNAATIPLLTPKMDRALEILRESFLNKRKVLVFAPFNRCGDLLREAAAGLVPAYWGAINGSTPQEERQSIIDEFTAHDGPGCLILNPRAAGAGLNITAATVVIHFTPVWNPAIEAQASARAYRRGQTIPVTIYRLFYEDTVERVMIDRALWKKELGNEIVPLSSRDNTDLKKALEIVPRKPQ